MVNFITAVIISYFLGSINFAYLLGKLMKVDISKMYNKNLGSSNLYDSINRKYKSKKLSTALFTVSALLDILKAYMPTILFGPIAGSFAVVGHCFSVFSMLKTRNIPTGLGVASSGGWLLAIDYRIFLLGLFLFLAFHRYFFMIKGMGADNFYWAFIYPFLLIIWIKYIGIDEETFIGYMIMMLSIMTARTIKIKNIFLQYKRKLKQYI